MADWVSIRADYVSGGGSFRVLAERYGISVSSIKKKAAAEQWTANRTRVEPKLYQKTVQKVLEYKSDQNADRLTRLLGVGDLLADKLEQSAKQLGAYTILKRKGNRVVEDDEGNRRVVEDTEEIAVPCDSIINTADAKRLASALKDLRDVAATPKTDEQSLAKIAEMMSRLDKEASSDGVSKPEADGVST